MWLHAFISTVVVTSAFIFYKRNQQRRTKHFYPIKIKLSDFLSGNAETHSQFRKSLLENRFVVFDLRNESEETKSNGGDNAQHLIKEYKRCVNTFFHESQEYKDTLLKREKDPLLMNRPVNKGYCFIKDVKEYLKLYRDENESNLIPNNPSELSEVFPRVFDKLKTVADKCLRVISESKSEDQKSVYMSPTFCDDVLRLQKSSISVIRYFATQKVVNDKLPDEISNIVNFEEFSTAQDAEKDKLHASTSHNKNESLTYPSKTHIDTGILTMIVCAEVPGLQVWHHGLGQWLEVEKLFTPGEDLFVIMGRKVPLFYCEGEDSSPFKATTHRVALPLDTERLSLLYFMDVTQ